MTILFSIGFIALIATIIFLTVATIKRQKRNIIISSFFIFNSLLILLVSGYQLSENNKMLAENEDDSSYVEGDSEEDTEDNQIAIPTSDDSEETDTSVEQKKETDDEDQIEESTKVKLGLALLKENFKDIAVVDYVENDKMYKLTPTDPDFTTAIIAVNSGNLTDEWDDLVSKMIDLSKSVQKNVGDGYVISLQNPQNVENTILMIKDGSIVYNFADK